MTRPKLLVGILAAACVGALLWYAWLIVGADLPRGATIATWGLWTVSAAAVVTLLAYLREFLRHRQAAGREASWKPLPSLVLLWIAGVTALVSFAFILPDKSRADGAPEPATASTSLDAQTVDASAGSAAGSRSTATSASRSGVSRTTPPVPVSTAAPGGPTRATSRPQASSTAATASRASTGSPTTTSTTSTPTTTTTPLIDITLLPTPRPR